MTEPVRPVPVIALSSPSAAPAGPLTGLFRWPGRRWLVAGVLFVPLVWLFGPAVLETPEAPMWSWFAAALLAFPGALILASYVPVPGSGRRVDVGCTPCAVVAGAAVVMALVFRAGAPTEVGPTLLCAAVLGFGLFQRLTDPGRCPTASVRTTDRGATSDPGDGSAA